MTNEEIIQELQACMMKLRKKAAESFKDKKNDTSKIVMTEIRKGYLDGNIIDRLVIFLKGTGCIATKRSGGCTFCGFYNATNFNKKISDSAYLEQLEKALNQNKEQNPVICIYNDGSLLCEEEISFSVLKEMMKKLEKLSFVKKVVLESRVVDISEKKITQLRDVFSKQLEIAVGYESANSNIRDYCVNKSFPTETFEMVVDYCKKYNVDIIPLIIFKPTFLTENEAIKDYIQSLKYLEKFNLKRIDMEIMSIEKDTLAYLLWRKKLFHPPWFWSVIETLKRKFLLKLNTPLYISPISYTVKAESMPSNCDNCDQIILKKFNDYNESRTVNIFDNITCSCKKTWEKIVHEKPNIESIPIRVSSYLKNIMNELSKPQ